MAWSRWRRQPATIPRVRAALAHAQPAFDAKVAPGLLSELFTEVEVERWDTPLLELPDAATVRACLLGKGVGREAAERTAAETSVPISVTPRGARVFARKPG